MRRTSPSRCWREPIEFRGQSIEGCFPYGLGISLFQYRAPSAQVQQTYANLPQDALDLSDRQELDRRHLIAPTG
jgi:hypothetical protein